MTTPNNPRTRSTTRRRKSTSTTPAPNSAQTFASIADSANSVDADSADKNPVPTDSSTPDSSTTDNATDNATDHTEELETMTVTTDDKQANAALIVKGEAESESALNVRPSYLGNRPVEPSTSKIIETFSAVGGSRPIFATDIKIADTIQASGIRPISASTLVISEQYSVMGGNRPVASNELDDVSLLMGYLD